MTKVFISSTFTDLEDYRKAAIVICKRLNLDPIGMEYFNSKGVGATEGCKEELDKADLYVGFYAHRYGYIEDPSDGRSVTEIEFDYAGERKLPRLCFIVDPKFSWPQEHIDYKNHDKQEAFKNDKVSKLVRREFTTVDNFESVLTTALNEWLRKQPPQSPVAQVIEDTQGRIGASSAILPTHPDDLTDKPDILFGRDALLTDVRVLLEKHDRVLLQGFGGMGKTALAATIAARWLTDAKGHVLWLKAGSSEADALFEALARPFNAQQAVASQTGDAKTKVLRDLLRGCGATLLVLDDCWNNKALFDVLKAIPSDMALLVTARQRYPLSKIREVDELAPSDALSLLAHHTDRDLSTDPQAVTLCDLLGNHAFAVEIAGKTLKAHNWTPTDLITHIKDAPDQLTMPLELSETGRENVAKLLEVSLNALDANVKAGFLAFGAFFAPQLTPEMLMRFLVKPPEVSDEQLAVIRSQNPQLPADMTDENLRQQYQKVLVNNADQAPVTALLDTLHLHGLAERLPATDENIPAYRIHDLAYSYAKAQNNDDLHQRALQACLSYTAHYNQPSLPNFAALRPELDNLLGAASWAFDAGLYASVEQFAGNLYVRSRFLDYAGFYSEATRLLTQAAESAERLGNKFNQASHLGNLSNAYSNLGRYQESIQQLSNVLQIARDLGDRAYEGNSLGNLGLAYKNLGQIEKAIDFHQQSLAIKRQIGDKLGEGNSLGNLGLAYSNLGQTDKAIDFHQQALFISRQIGDKRGEGNSLGNLGTAYNALGQTDKAIDFLQQSLAIKRQIGDKRGEGNSLGNLGTVYNALGQTDKALQHYQQARSIFAAIGAQHLVAQADRNIARAQAKMNGKEAISTKDNDAEAKAAQILLALEEIYSEQGENALRTKLKEMDMEDAMIEQIMTLIKGVNEDNTTDTPDIS